jgi:hypothetical protein
MKTPRYVILRNTLTIVAFGFTSQLKAQLPFYVTIEAGQNYALQPNQLVTLVGIDVATGNKGGVVGTFPDGNTVNINFLSNKQIFTGLTNLYVPSNNGEGAATFAIAMQPFGNPNFLPVIPQGASAVIQLQTSYNLVGGQWTNIYSQVYTNSSPTNQFFRLSLMVQ